MSLRPPVPVYEAFSVSMPIRIGLQILKARDPASVRAAREHALAKAKTADGEALKAAAIAASLPS